MEKSKIVRPVFPSGSGYLNYSAASFFKDIKELRPVFRRLSRFHITYIGELVQKSRDDILVLGKATPELVDLLEKELATIGLGLEMDVRGWTAEIQPRWR